jgi:hypothetical protein
MRFLIEVLRGVRAAVPSDFIVSLRMSPDEAARAAPDAAECLAVATAARDEGLIDLVNLIGPGGATNASIAQVIPAWPCRSPRGSGWRAPSASGSGCRCFTPPGSPISAPRPMRWSRARSTSWG